MHVTSAETTVVRDGSVPAVVVVAGGVVVGGGGGVVVVIIIGHGNLTLKFGQNWINNK